MYQTGNSQKPIVILLQTAQLPVQLPTELLQQYCFYIFEEEHPTLPQSLQNCPVFALYATADRWTELNALSESVQSEVVLADMEQNLRGHLLISELEEKWRERQLAGGNGQ